MASGSMKNSINPYLNAIERSIVSVRSILRSTSETQIKPQFMLDYDVVVEAAKGMRNFDSPALNGLAFWNLTPSTFPFVSSATAFEYMRFIEGQKLKSLERNHNPDTGKRTGLVAAREFGKLFGSYEPSWISKKELDDRKDMINLAAILKNRIIYDNSPEFDIVDRKTEIHIKKQLNLFRNKKANKRANIIDANNLAGCALMNKGSSVSNIIFVSNTRSITKLAEVDCDIFDLFKYNLIPVINSLSFSIISATFLLCENIKDQFELLNYFSSQINGLQYTTDKFDVAEDDKYKIFNSIILACIESSDRTKLRDKINKYRNLIETGQKEILNQRYPGASMLRKVRKALKNSPVNSKLDISGYNQSVNIEQTNKRGVLDGKNYLSYRYNDAYEDSNFAEILKIEGGDRNIYFQTNYPDDNLIAKFISLIDSSSDGFLRIADFPVQNVRETNRHALSRMLEIEYIKSTLKNGLPFFYLENKSYIISTSSNIVRVSFHESNLGDIKEDIEDILDYSFTELKSEILKNNALAAPLGW